MIDGTRLLDTSGTQLKQVNGYALLSNAMKQKFATLNKTGVSGSQYLDITFADSAGGRMVFVVGWDTRSNRSLHGGGVVVYDASSRQVISSFSTPYPEAPFEGTYGTPTVHLTPNGKGVVVEHYEWITPPQSLTGEKLERAKTGELAVYDADTGTLMNKIALRPAPGISGRLVNFSEDGRFLYYTSHEHMYVVDLTAAQVASTFALPAGFTPIAVLPVNP